MPRTPLCGASSVGNQYHVGSDFLVNAFQASLSGIADRISVYSLGNGTGKFSVYDESGEKIYSNDNAQSCSAGQWNTFTIDNTAITAGTNYYLGGNGSATGVLSWYTGTPLVCKSRTETYSTFVAPDDLTGAWNVYSYAVGALRIEGWVPPVITDIDTDEKITHNQTAVSLTATNLMDSGCKLYLSNSSTWGYGIIVEQTITAQNDTSITFNVVSGALSNGPAYAWVLTTLGQHNATAFPVTLSGIPIYPNEIIENLILEIESNIKAIVSNRPIDPRIVFERFIPDANNQDIRNYSASPREFQIFNPIHVGDFQIGYNTTHPEFTVDVIFAYPDSNDPAWNAAAADDMDKICWYFRTTPSLVGGVSARYVGQIPVVNIKSADDLRRYWTITISVHAEVSH